MDWTFYVPKLRNYIVLYGDAYAEDDILPIENPPRILGIPDSTSLESPESPGSIFTSKVSLPSSLGLIALAGGGNRGIFNYWNQNYQDGNTDNGYLIGNVVGRDGRTVQSWFTYWLCCWNTLVLSYKHNTVLPISFPVEEFGRTIRCRTKAISRMAFI